MVYWNSNISVRDAVNENRMNGKAETTIEYIKGRVSVGPWGAVEESWVLRPENQSVAQQWWQPTASRWAFGHTKVVSGAKFQAKNHNRAIEKKHLSLVVANVITSRCRACNLAQSCQAAKIR